MTSHLIENICRTKSTSIFLNNLIKYLTICERLSPVIKTDYCKKHFHYSHDLCVCQCVQDERNQVLTTYLWIRQVWYDAYLKWDKEEYDNLEMINIPSDLVWKPDIVLYNKSVAARRVKKCNYVDKDLKCS